MDSVHSKDKKPIKFVKRQVPEHPYCTNWPMSEKEEITEVRVTAPKESIGWVEAMLPKSVMSRLQSYIETAKKNPINWNNELAGNISKSLILEDKDGWFFNTILVILINQFLEKFPSYFKLGSHQKKTPFSQQNPLMKNLLSEIFVLEPFWVNFQKETEFNPIHSHSGTFSFVIWIKIPTDWREQHALPISDNSNSPKASDFEFIYTTMLGYIRTEQYFLDKEAEGKMLFFPAKLMHQVYPFYNCDKERISISGNIRFDTNENSIKRYNAEMKEKNGKKSS